MLSLFCQTNKNIYVKFVKGIHSAVGVKNWLNNLYGKINGWLLIFEMRNLKCNIIINKYF